MLTLVRLIVLSGMEMTKTPSTSKQSILTALYAEMARLKTPKRGELRRILHQLLPETGSFNSWYSRHPCDTNTLWHIQNCLGDVLGWDHEATKQATEAWQSFSLLD